MIKKNKTIRKAAAVCVKKVVTVRVHPADDGGMGQDFTPTDYTFKTQAEADAFMSGVSVGNAHECNAEVLP